MPEENNALISCLFEGILNGKGFDAVDDLIAAEYVEHAALPGQGTDPEGVKEQLIMLRDGFPDFRYSLEDPVAKGDKLVARWTMEGTHRGEFAGSAATGKGASVSGIDVYRVAGDKVAEH